MWLWWGKNANRETIDVALSLAESGSLVLLVV